MVECLADAVEGLYEVFGRVPRPVRVEGCPHCVGPDEDRPLLRGPVRAVEPGVLARYAAEALNTWGDVPEFRYFLPRLLECAAADAFVYPDPPIVFGKLAVAGWTGWADEERAAIEVFLDQWWTATLDRFPSRPGVETVVYSLAGVGMDLGPLLDRWGRLENVEAVRHLHEFVLYEMAWGNGHRLNDAFWDRRDAGYRQVIAWLTDGRAVRAVERAFEEESREDVLRLLEETYSCLDP